MLKMLLLCLCIVTYANATEKTVFTFVNKNKSTIDSIRSSFTYKVFVLALEKTAEDYGEYEIEASKSGVTVGRLYLQLASRSDNFFYKVSITDELLKDFHAIPFPIERGVVGYRIGIIHKDNYDQFKMLVDKKGFRKKIIVQALGWLDNDILKYNGLDSIAVTTIDQCLDMVARKRADVYFRGINEVSRELQWRKEKLGTLNIVADPHIVLHYPMPKFFITAKSNIKNAQRVEEGFKRAYADGSFNALWEENNLEAIQSQQLHNRTIIELENPFISQLDESYKKYNYPVQSSSDVHLDER